MFTIEPPPAWRMAGIAYFVPRNTPLAFTAITWSHSAAVRSSIGTRGMMMAALLIRMSSRPWRRVAVCTACCQSASLVTSRCTYVASPPAARMVASTFWPSVSRMSPKTTLAPSRANVSASAAPCPRAPPLISATFPSSFPMAADYTPELPLPRYLSDDADAGAQRVPGQVGERQILHLHHVDGRAIGAGRDRLVLDKPASAVDGLLPGQILEDLVDLAAHLGDRGAHRVGDSLMRHIEDFGHAGEACRHEERPAAHRDQ